MGEQHEQSLAVEDNAEAQLVSHATWKHASSTGRCSRPVSATNHRPAACRAARRLFRSSCVRARGYYRIRQVGQRLSSAAIDPTGCLLDGWKTPRQVRPGQALSSSSGPATNGAVTVSPSAGAGQLPVGDVPRRHTRERAVPRNEEAGKPGRGLAGVHATVSVFLHESRLWRFALRGLSQLPVHHCCHLGTRAPQGALGQDGGHLTYQACKAPQVLMAGRVLLRSGVGP